MNIILIGFMGTGKTAVGKRLAEKLKMNFLDADTLIENTSQMKISDIFAHKGEAVFRDLESSVLKTLKEYDNFVIATGGGIILRAENVIMLKQLGPVILLSAQPDVIYERVKEHTHRPLLAEGDKQKKIQDILEKRLPFYDQAADFKIDTSKMAIDQVVEEIIHYVKH